MVGEYIDDADATSSPSLYGYNSLDIRTYDLARVEVLRGPQGTLYGEGSIGGAIHFVTAEPELNAVQLGIRAESLFTKGGQPSENVFPVINVPLIQGTLGIRIAGEFDHQGGWINFPAAGQRAVNSADLADTRIQALWRLSPKFTAKVLEIIHRKSYVIPQGERERRLGAGLQHGDAADRARSLQPIKPHTPIRHRLARPVDQYVDVLRR